MTSGVWGNWQLIAVKVLSQMQMTAQGGGKYIKGSGHSGQFLGEVDVSTVQLRFQPTVTAQSSW